MLETVAYNMQDFAASYAAYRQWQTAWIRPVERAVNEHRFQQARELHEAARAAMHSRDDDAALNAARQYLLLYWHCRINWHPHSLGYDYKHYEEMLARFTEPAGHALADCIRRNYLVQIRCNGTSDGFDELSRRELDELLEPLPQQMAAAAWQQAARWAWEQGDREILARAYEVFLECSGVTMSHAKWQRVSLMHKLMEGTATRRDVHSYMKLIELRPQLREFRNEFWERCRELCLVDSELEQLMAEMEAEIGRG